MIRNISPIDGRYATKTKCIRDYFSEYGLFKYRVWVEVQYFLELAKYSIGNLNKLNKEQLGSIAKISDKFGVKDAEKIKEIEKTTNHDVKAVEYFIKHKFEELGLEEYSEYIHFGLTSQDINNTAIPASLHDAGREQVYPQLRELLQTIQEKVEEFRQVPMLSRTHGQPASPTTMGKEWHVFAVRLEDQFNGLKHVPPRAKFGGATGAFNAHFVAFPDIDWFEFANNFCRDSLGLERSRFTTQIDHYDLIAAYFHALSRINTILIDFCSDIWTYISIDYFTQKTKSGEIGSSAMPHKVNPIDFENAEGNLAYANAICEFLARKLPISRLQRDLTDSTVLRNIGVPIAHSIIAYQSILKGINKLQINTRKIRKDLNDHWIILSEAIQTILRREGIEKPYEKLLDLTRGKGRITKKDLHQFIDTLDVTKDVKVELKKLTPFNYIGRWES